MFLAFSLISINHELEEFQDSFVVILINDDGISRAHKVILSVFSPFVRNIWYDSCDNWSLWVWCLWLLFIIITKKWTASGKTQPVCVPWQSQVARVASLESQPYSKSEYWKIFKCTDKLTFMVVQMKGKSGQMEVEVVAQYVVADNSGFFLQ